MKLLSIIAISILVFSFSDKAFAATENPQYKHVDAKNYCASLGQRLPSAREMAQYAIEHGAKGILEPQQYKNQPGYMAINKLANNDYTTVLDFYYNSEGFASSESLQKPWLWTSSYGPHNVDFVYVFNLETGEIDFDARIMTNGVRCVKQ